MQRPRLQLLLLLTACACAPATRRTAPAAPAATASAWVDSTLASLDLREKVGQMVMPWIGGGYLAEGGPEYDRLRHWVVDDRVGGVVISIGPPLEVAAKLNTLQRMAAVPLLVSSDMEHGPGQRLNGAIVYPYGLEVGGGTEFPPPWASAPRGIRAWPTRMGRVTAEEARAVGIQMDFAPVSDVNNNPANPIINTRSYGEDPAAVARMVSAQLRGMQEHGMLATAKHFPGHGDTGTDSHIALPIITADTARVRSVELVPFRAAVQAGVDAVMSAHIAFPALTGDTVPATLSPALLTGLLRRDLGFGGIIVTDALDMGAVAERFGGADRVPVLAVLAGADILLMPHDVDTAIDAVVRAVRSGEIAESRIDASVRRLLRAKASVGLQQRREVDLGSVQSRVGTPEHTAVAERAATLSITAVRDRQKLLPITGAPRVLSIVYSDDADPFAGRVLQRDLAAALPRLRVAQVDSRTDSAALDSLRQAADSADVVLVSPFVRVLARKGDVAVAPGFAALVATLAATRSTIVTSFGNPYILQQFPGVGTYVLAWGQSNAMQHAAARALTGRAAITGRLPIAIPPALEIGDGVSIEAVAALGGAGR